MLTVVRYPSKVVHRGLIRGERVVPMCMPETTKRYVRLPGHMTVRCKACLRKPALLPPRATR